MRSNKPSRWSTVIYSCIFTLHSSFSGSGRRGSLLHLRHHPDPVQPQRLQARCVTMPLVFHQLQYLEVFSAAVGWEIAKHPCHLKRRIMIPVLLTEPHRWASANNMRAINSTRLQLAIKHNQYLIVWELNVARLRVCVKQAFQLYYRSLN